MNIVKAINKLKNKKNAIILAHNYMVPSITNGVADFVGDSLTMAIAAQETDADIIIVAGVKFMATTAKVMNPEKKVFSPAMSGCSLASSISVCNMRYIRTGFPNTPIVSYVNVEAGVMAEADYACTSANAVKVVEYAAQKTGSVVMVPDGFLAANTQKALPHINIFSHAGTCEVHERFEWEDLNVPDDTLVYAHPECKPSVVEKADAVGSTGMLKDEILALPANSNVALLTECSMSANLQKQRPDINFVGACNLCPYMQEVTLENIYSTLLYEENEVLLRDDIIKRAEVPIQRMLEIA